ncbi:VMAP-C domain-containing protein [Paractinoplanes atraurantiacus]|uniref:Trypsin-like peptidase domain-containing protein n=1 Tax=Paractinoplanes atraurantiacus TaxID=1036182 RepID=A0A285KKC4_9ACTN|nr:trypsin-like peptidase domain-containing protein [Actinoplanes atraurantiacus]SNY73055.1 Trypsin-like peptidase domain-containing protein [Actinoplanes atraurantiacus]
MTEAFWQARVDIPGTIRWGSGFLVTNRHVVTCAHVVRGHEEAQVTLRDGTTAKGTVLRHGPWWTPQSEGADVAVLELTEPVDVRPARLGPYAALEIYAGQSLDIFGFPDRHRENGVHTGYTAEPHHLVGADIQLSATDAIGVRLQEGFSGAAVVHGPTQQVVGMVRKAATGDERIGLMVPVGTLVEHCPALGEQIWLGPFDPAVYRGLREALRRVHCRPERLRRILSLVRRQVPALRADLRTVEGVVEALVVDTVTVDDRETRYHLRGMLGELESDPVDEWVIRELGAGERTEQRAVRPGPLHDGGIVVCLEPIAGGGGESYRLKIWTVTEADGLLEEPVADVSGLARGEWQERVEHELLRALERIPRTVREVAVEFVLPRMFLSEPVDEWFDHREDTPLGVSRPVMVRDLDWFINGEADVLAQRTDDLRSRRAGVGDALMWRDCTDPLPRLRSFKAWLRMNGSPRAFGLAGEWSRPEFVVAAVAAGPPVLLWQRRPCASGVHAEDVECTGRRFVRELKEELAGVPVDALADKVRQLRAVSMAEEDAGHCGSGLVLLRDDGQRRPMVLGFAEQEQG